jgi:hypothetical protein
MNYTVYTTATGEIISTGTSNVTDIADIGVSSGQTAVEGTYPPGQFKFVEGTATAIAEDPLDYVRSHRTYLLRESDWTQTADSPLTDEKKAEWATYRQTLRDLPSTDPIVWPTEPS